PRRMAPGLESGETAGLRLIGVDREGLVVAAARMRDVIDAAAERTAVPGVINVEGERRMHPDGRLQSRRQVPRLEADARGIFTGAAGRRHRHTAAVAGDDMARRIEVLNADLQPLDRGVDEARGAADETLLAQHVPGLERLAQLEIDAAGLH